MDGWWGGPTCAVCLVLKANTPLKQHNADIHPELLLLIIRADGHANPVGFLQYASREPSFVRLISLHGQQRRLQLFHLHHLGISLQRPELMHRIRHLYVHESHRRPLRLGHQHQELAVRRRDRDGMPPGRRQLRPVGPGGFGPGWTYSTYTSSVTTTITSGTARITTVVLATVAQAASGTSTTKSTTSLGLQQTELATTNAAAGLKIMGAALGAVVVGAGLM